jgi:hypothetical protein
LTHENTPETTACCSAKNAPAISRSEGKSDNLTPNAAW